MAKVQKAILTEYTNDGSVVMSNIRKGKADLPIIGSNETYSATLVTEWYDGSPMDDSKADGYVYLKYKGTEYPNYTGSYFRVNLPNFGELFLEKPNVDSLRNMSSTEILLLRMGYYKGVTLLGYYAENGGDTPAPIDYIISDTVESDDGGSVFEVSGIKLEHEFVGEVHGAYFGVSPIMEDNTNTLKNLFKYLEINVVDVKLPTGTINISLVLGEVFYNFNNIKNIQITGVDTTIQDNLSYSTSEEELATMFRFDESENISFRGINFRSQIYDMTIPAGEYSGAFWFKIRNGSSNISVEGNIYGGSRGVSASSREDDGQFLEKPSRISLTGKMEYIRYPFSCTFGGDNSTANITTLFCGRSFFVYNCSYIDLNVVAKNVGTSLISVYNGGNVSNINIRYEDLDSDYNYPSKAEKISIHYHFENNLPCVIDNINIDINARNYPTGWGHTISIDKFLGGGSTPDTEGRGHTLSNVTIKGYIKGETGLNNIGTIRGSFLSPDIISNIRLENLVLDGLGSNNINFNDCIDNSIKCTNVRVLLNRTLAINNTSGLTEFTNCEAESFTGSTSVASKHKYINCIARNTSIQAIDNNKEFINTKVGFRTFNRKNNEGNLYSVTSGNTIRGVGDEYVSLFKVSSSAGLFKISYYLVDNLNQPSSARNERYGQKTFFASVSSSGVGVINSSVNDIITPSIKGVFDEDIEVSFINGDTEGALIAFRCLKLVGEDSRISVNLEVVGTSQNVTIQTI